MEKKLHKPMDVMNKKSHIHFFLCGTHKETHRNIDN